jgi:hypothetical protein
MGAIDEIAAERRRQIEAEGWALEHDDLHGPGELSRAGACYAMAWTGANAGILAEEMWPWDFEWWKPKGPRRDLIRAAALIVAEIERLDRDEERRGAMKSRAVIAENATREARRGRRHG